MPVELQRRLTAAQKTIASLMKRVETKVGAGASAFAVMEQNIALEQIVAQKTSQLERQRALLQTALEDLKRVQVELLQTQRLETVARLASGIAHELNTPLQFVSDSVHFIGEAFGQLAALLNAHRTIVRLATQGPVELLALEQLQSAVEQADLESLLKHAPDAIARATDGLATVGSLVRALKEFAQPLHGAMAPAHLNRAIVTTLAVAKNQYRNVAELQTDLGELPLVTCALSELNQVFLSLIVNAAQAIEDRVDGTGAKGKICVRTWAGVDEVSISIADDGAGIPEEIWPKIFDPFFTTKQVGRGTGQGLAIARSVVVDQHGGSLTFESKAGQGTTFLIRLPVAGRAPTEAR